MLMVRSIIGNKLAICNFQMHASVLNLVELLGKSCQISHKASLVTNEVESIMMTVLYNLNAKSNS